MGCLRRYHSMISIPSSFMSKIVSRLCCRSSISSPPVQFIALAGNVSRHFPTCLQKSYVSSIFDATPLFARHSVSMSCRAKSFCYVGHIPPPRSLFYPSTCVRARSLPISVGSTCGMHFCVGSAQHGRNMRSFAQRTLGLAPLANQANLPDSQLRRDRAIKAQSSQYLSLSSQCTRNSVICPQFCPVSSFSREEKIECLETCLKTCLDMSGTCHVLSSI